MDKYPQKQGLYDPRYEHDACGIGAVVNIQGKKSHQIIKDSLEILVNLEHRGGTGAEDNSGDGAGILVQIPHRFFEAENLGFKLPKCGDYAVAQIFLSPNQKIKEEGIEIFKEALEETNLVFLGLRTVPVNPINIGLSAKKAMPFIVQAFVERPKDVKKGIDFERILYLARRRAEKKALEKDNHLFYICSFSSKTIVYKGMLVSTQVEDFYIDLKNTLFESSIALVHSRFSTNTFPSWERAHPNRMMIHNGEINTILGNVDSIFARSGLFKKGPFESLDFLPVIAKASSDSAMFDNTLEFLYLSGRSLPEAIMMMIPEPWSKNPEMSSKLKAFYEYNSTMMEPWDGPASIVSTDGDIVLASLDRNGLRPSRYVITNDGFMILSSETGALKIDEERIKEKRRLEPGKLLMVDTKSGCIVANDDLKNQVASKNDYEEWVKEIVPLKATYHQELTHSKEKNLILETAFGYSYDNIIQGIIPAANKGEEMLVSMGKDTPLAVYSKQYHPLYDYFKQNFAQVTNPPIDAIREDIVTSTKMYLGREGNMLEIGPKNAHRVAINSPILSNDELYSLEKIDGFKVKKIDILFTKNEGIEERLKKICEDILLDINDGGSIFVLSDRNIDETHIPIPAMLAVSRIHQFLVEKSLRTHCSLVIESGEPCEIHHYACLLGFGASAICPYLVYEVIYDNTTNGLISVDYKAAIKNYIKAAIKGIVKISSKMGISTLQSYNGSKIFEAIGLDNELVFEYFGDIANTISKKTLKDIEKDVISLHHKAYNDILIALDSVGSHGLKNGREDHLYNPLSIYYLQTATKNNDYQAFKEYTKLVDKNRGTIRSHIAFKKGQEIDLDLVEPVESILKRFKTGAMSFGSISKEAHEALAVAMNMIGAKSNTGEGGELKERLHTNKSSKIKQIASGRFGVTAEYLLDAEEIQIKMAQGAKPGEGGQLPALKVYPWVAKARHSTPGVTLISPPPHHDIYSIEDLAQLIYDLKNINRNARISVKLVSEKGVGTVASGVCKAGANVILISGFDGGTGASPRTSINNCGMPWELGLADAHQTLIMNKLRERVILEVDGKLMSGRDLATAILLGAEEFGFATLPLIALGCCMMRVCNLDTCPVGIATQSEELRKNFKGKPEYVVNLMYFLASELREYMALLGFRTIDEMVGRYDMLKFDEGLEAFIMNKEVMNQTNVHFQQIKPLALQNTLDEMVLLPLCNDAINQEKRTKISIEIQNVNRALGTILSSEITKKTKGAGLPRNTISINAYGHAGNSCGAFLVNGVSISIFGDANDYLGKGLSGGIISVALDENSKLKANENIIAGNVALYGATNGELYLDGIAGERFCVRNSGANAVVLGMGQHGLEYMTGGTVLVLGPFGRNLCSGMSGGVAYLYKPNCENINQEYVDIKELDNEDFSLVCSMATDHIRHTNSQYVRDLFKSMKKEDFIKVIPRDYELINQYKKEFINYGYSNDEALYEAFIKKTKEAR